MLYNRKVSESESSDSRKGPLGAFHFQAEVQVPTGNDDKLFAFSYYNFQQKSEIYKREKLI